MKKHYSWSPFHSTIPHHTQKPLSATFSSPLGIGKLRQTRLKLLNPKENFTNPPTTKTPALAEILGSLGIFKDDTEPFQPLPWFAGTKIHTIPYGTSHEHQNSAQALLDDDTASDEFIPLIDKPIRNFLKEGKN